MGAGFFFRGACVCEASTPALPVELKLAMLAAKQAFDPRSDSQWGACNKPIFGDDAPWMARHAFNAERIRAVLTAVYYRGPLSVDAHGATWLVIEAARAKGVAEIDLIVSRSSFLELRSTFRPPVGVRVLFPDPQEPKDRYRVNIRFLR
jgi:hypothetical protein